MATKRLKIKEGCYIQKLSKGKVNRCHNVYECTSLKKKNSKVCKIKDIFTANPKETTSLVKNVIPQTVVYYHKDCLKHKPLKSESYHHEQSSRILQPMLYLKKYGLLDKVKLLKPKEATNDQLSLTHHKDHLNKISRTENIAKAHRHKYSLRSNDDSDDEDIDMTQDNNDRHQEQKQMDLDISENIGWLDHDRTRSRTHREEYRGH